MSQFLFAKRSIRWSLLVCALTGLLLFACAAPPPPQATIRTIDVTPGPVLYVLDTAATADDIREMLAGIDGSEYYPIGSLSAMRGNYYAGLPLHSDGAGLVIPEEADAPQEIWPDLLAPFLVGRSPVACMEYADNIYWVFDLAAMAELAPEAAVVTHCGEVVEDEVCPECGCIGPMGGNPPRCTRDTMNVWYPQAVMPTPTPLP